MRRWIAGLGAAGAIMVAFLFLTGADVIRRGVTTVYNLMYRCTGTGCVSRPIASKLGDVVAVADFSGTDFCDQLLKAINSLPAAGGVVDARMITGTVSCASNPFLNMTTPTAVLFGDTTINVSVPWVITFSPVQLVGNGTTSTILQYTGGASAYFIKVGTATPSTTFVQEFRLENMLIRGSANTTDVIFMTGMHRSYINQIELMDATNCGLKTAFAVVNTFKSVHVTRLGSNGNFVVQPARGLCFDQIDASHATTASTVVDPVVEGVTGTGILLSGAQGMVITGGTSEGNNRGIEMSLGSDRNAIIDIDMEVNTVEDMLIGSSHNIFMGVLASSSSGGALGAHLSSTATDNVLTGGLYTSVQIDSGAKSNTLDLGFNGAGVTDNGTDTRLQRLWDNNNTRNTGIPWSARDTIPQISMAGIGVPDKQDFLAGVYTFTTSATTISNTVLTASKPWRVLFIGEWINNAEGGGLAQPAPFIEATSVAPSFAIGSLTVTLSLNGSNQLQAVSSANNVGFSGRIFVISHNQAVAGTASMLLQGSLTAGSFVTGATTIAAGSNATTLSSTAATTRVGLRNANTRNITRNSSVAAVDCAGAALNATVTQLLDGAIFTCATAQTLTLPTWQGASGTVQALPGTPAVGDVIQFTMNSTAAAAFTLAGGTGGTVVGNAAVNNAGRVWTCRLTNVGAGTEAASCY